MIAGQNAPLNKDEKFITELRACFLDAEARTRFCSRVGAWPINPEVSSYTAYRYIALQVRGDSEVGAWEKTGLDFSRIRRITSWSRTVDGATEAASANMAHDGHVILVEGVINGFDLQDYCRAVLAHFDANTTLARPAHVSLLREQLALYQEQEIVSVEVVDFNVIRASRA
jgi:hypothetical protein